MCALIIEKLVATVELRSRVYEKKIMLIENVVSYYTVFLKGLRNGTWTGTNDK